MTKKINIDEDKINNTQIVVTVKTLMGILTTVAGGLYLVYNLVTGQQYDLETKMKEDHTEVMMAIKELDKDRVLPLEKGFIAMDKQLYFLTKVSNSKRDQLIDNGGPSEALLDTTSGPPN